MTQQTENSKTQSKIDYRIHVVVADGRDDRIGASIGVAFNNKNGNGFTAYLDAMPIPLDGRIKLVGLVPDSKS